MSSFLITDFLRPTGSGDQNSGAAIPSDGDSAEAFLKQFNLQALLGDPESASGNADHRAHEASGQTEDVLAAILALANGDLELTEANLEAAQGLLNEGAPLTDIVQRLMDDADTPGEAEAFSAIMTVAPAQASSVPEETSPLPEADMATVDTEELLAKQAPSGSVEQTPEQQDRQTIAATETVGGAARAQTGEAELEPSSIDPATPVDAADAETTKPNRGMEFAGNALARETDMSTSQAPGTNEVDAPLPTEPELPRADTSSDLIGRTADVKNVAAPGFQTASVSTELASGGDAASSPLLATGAAPASGTPAAQSVSPQLPAPANTVLTPANYVAAPSDIPTIVAQSLSSDELHNRVHVQLDPPELGRVSLEFKFDSQGLQHVVVTADSADAIRRIRAFHPELVSVLEQHGLSGNEMTFREQASGQNAADWRAQGLPDPEEDAEIAASAPTSPATSAARTGTTGLDIRV